MIGSYLTEEISEYIDAIDGENPEKINELLAFDQKNRKSERQLTRRPNNKVLKFVNRQTESTSDKLTDLASTLMLPRPESREIVRTHYCTHQTNNFKITLFSYNIASPEAAGKIELPEEFGFDLKESKLIQVRDFILVFKPMKEEEKIAVYKLEKLDSNKPTCKALPSLDYWVIKFAVACYHEHTIYLSGGKKGDMSWDTLNRVQAFDLVQNEWRDVPSLCSRRAYHQSICSGDQVYVFGDANKKYIEVYCPEGPKGENEYWEKICKAYISERSSAATACIDQNTILVFGGFDKKSGYLFDIVSKQVKPILGSKENMEVECFGQAHVTSKQTIITAGIDRKDQHVKLVQLFMNKSRTFFELKPIVDFGHYAYPPRW